MNADPYISILTEPAILELNKYGKIRVTAGNAGNDQIVENSLRIVLSCSNNGRITSFSSGSGWAKFKLSAQKAGNTLVLSQIRKFGSFDLSDIMVRVRGTVIGKASTISGHVGYVTANNPLLHGNALNASQGNASATNDNSTTSLTVVK